MQSAFEKEIVHLMLRFRGWLASHDRAVLIGLVFAIPPVPPVPILGLLISLFNYRLWKQHKLENHEIGLIRWALVLSVISSILALALVWIVIQVVTTVDAHALAAKGGDTVVNYVQRLFDLLPFRRRGEISI